MRLQPMPVRSAMRQPGRLIRMGVGHERSVLSQNANQEAFDVCKHVWFGKAPTHTDILQLKSGRLMKETVGPQRLPFDHLWLEGIWDFSTGGGMEGATAYAVYAYSDDAMDPDTRQRVVVEATSYQIFALANDGTVRRVPMAVINLVDQQGCVAATSVAQLNPEGNFLATVDELSDEHLWAISMVAPAMWAIGLMNCKNVRLEERSTAKMSRKQRRKRPDLKYHTIVLPGSQAKSSGANEGDASLVAQHRVRGHFKTFTADAPLMGQHVGTYWWGWQVRGKKENGIVVSDYKVGASA